MTFSFLSGFPLKRKPDFTKLNLLPPKDTKHFGTPSTPQRVFDTKKRPFDPISKVVKYATDPHAGTVAMKGMDGKPMYLPVDMGVGGTARATVKTATQVPNAIQKLVGAIKGAAKPRAALDVAQSAERSSRAGEVASVFQQGGGQQGYRQALGKLKGDLAPDKRTFDKLDLDQTDVDDLFNQVQSHPHLDIYEKVSASNGLQKLLDGELPPPSQLSLMEDVFGKELIEAAQAHRPFLTKVGEMAADVLNMPRSLITSIDMSAPLRQGVLLTATKPKAAAGAFGQMFKQVFSQKNFDRWLEDIPNNPRYRQMKDSKLYIANPNKMSGGLNAREERFMSTLAERIPFYGAVVRASGRAYVSYLNKLRVDTFTQLATKFEQEGIDTPQNLKSLADWVNNATGRGSLGKLNDSTAVLNNIFFSPRLIAARFNTLNPVWYAKQTAPVRKEAIKSMAQFIGVGSTILAIAKAGGADVELDPRSTDFGKIRVGNTRWDTWGGFQQWVRVFSQMASGSKKTAKGDIVKLDGNKYPYTTRLDVAGNFLRGKLAPVPGLALELMDGQKLFGGDITLTEEIAENTIPLYLQDMEEAINQIGPEALFTVGVPAFFGVGSQTYEETQGAKKRAW